MAHNITEADILRVLKSTGDAVGFTNTGSNFADVPVFSSGYFSPMGHSAVKLMTGWFSGAARLSPEFLAHQTHFTSNAGPANDAARATAILNLITEKTHD